jgi:pentatricopeptide repeat protein
MMAEELNEYLEAQDNLTETADALIDMFEILLGMFAEHGMLDKLEKLYDEVHRSNMSKLNKFGYPVYRDDGKVLKGEYYSAPDFKSILNE